MKLLRVVLSITASSLIVFGLQAPAGAAANTTIALYSMNEPAGSSVLVDSSGNGINGTIGGEVTAGAVYDGAIGHRYAYLAPNTPPAHPEHIDRVSSSRLNPGTGDFAVTVRYRTTRSFGNIIQKGQSGTQGGYFKFENPNGIVTCLFRGSGGQNGVSAGRALNDGQWHTLRCERVGNSVAMYVDGVLAQRKAGATGSISNNVPLTIAGKSYCDQISITCDYFVGDIDYVRIEGPGGTPSPDVTPPSAPGAPVGVSTVPGQASLTWAAATDDRATSLTYSVFRDGGSTPVATVPGGTTGTIAFTDTGLEFGSTHRWSVRASDGINTGAYSALSAAVTIAGGGTSQVLAGSDFTNGLAGWTNVQNMTVDAAVGSPTDEAPSARTQVASAAGTARLRLSATAMAACAEVDTRVTSVTGTGFALLKLRNSVGSALGRVVVSSTGALSVRADVSGTTIPTPAVIAPGTWHRVGLCATIGTAGSLSLRVDGVQVGTWAANTGTSAIAVLQIGDNDPRTATANWDAALVTRTS